LPPPRSELKFREIGAPILSVIVAILIWQFVADVVVQKAFILPSFSAAILALCEIWEMMLIDAAVSLFHFGIGLALGILFGIPIGAAMGWFKTVDRALDPIVEVIRPIPPIAWIPFAIISLVVIKY